MYQGSCAVEQCHQHQVRNAGEKSFVSSFGRWHLEDGMDYLNVRGCYQDKWDQNNYQNQMSEIDQMNHIQAMFLTLFICNQWCPDDYLGCRHLHHRRKN